MAASTGYILTAGAIVLADKAVNTDPHKKINPADYLYPSAAIFAAAVLAAGLDKAIPGLGTGTALVLLVGVVLTKGADVISHLPGNPKAGK